MQEQTDISRMIDFILHEAEEKVAEIKIRTTEEYKLTKARVIKKNTDNYLTKKNKKLEEIKKYFVTKESQIKNKYKLMLQRKKEMIADELFERVANKLKKVETTKMLIENTKNKINEYNEMDFDLDMKNGVVIKSKDQRTMVDNSYETRIGAIRKNYMDKINTLIFK
ncbi:V-type H+-transporting ATPase subunit E [Spraguea lophii 42_110]|uniref:V-type H+-transporting ATPase subunit E n=1 Tax=Spraguea lophii (strain 42_110) TaxID=1358809 RepID=S7W809_SPRLO|nr:V-type H+-transporting ATPase subunit E [Spraguea lophii 42_110]